MPISQDSATPGVVPAFGSTRTGGVISAEDIAHRPYAPATTRALRHAVARHNSRHGTDPAKRVGIRALRQVYRRGFAKGGAQGGQERVNAHLATLAAGLPPQGHTPDDDLLPRGHPCRGGKQPRASRVKALAATAQARAGQGFVLERPRPALLLAPPPADDLDDGPSFDDLEAADADARPPDLADLEGLPEGAELIDPLPQAHEADDDLDDGYDQTKAQRTRPEPAAIYSTQSKAAGIPTLDWPSTPEVPAGVSVERKVSADGQTLSIDDDGLVWAIVNVTGLPDQVDDITLPGCFQRTLQLRIPKGVWCADIGTDILTDRGWLHYDEVRVGDRAYALDTRTGDARYEPISAVNIFPAEPRRLRHIRSATFDSMTTADHRWPVADSRGDVGWTTTEKMATRDGILRSLPRSDAPTAAKYDDAFIEVVAWAWCEGHLGPQSRKVTTPRLSIAQSQTANPGKCAMIRRALDACFPGGWWEQAASNGTGREFRLAVEPTRAVASVLGPDKAPLATFLTDLTLAQLLLLIDTCLKADGHVEPSGTARWTQRSERGINAFEMACALAGIGTSRVTRRSGLGHYGRDVYSVTLLRRLVARPLAALYERRRAADPARQRTVGADEWVTYSGPVWCPTTPSGTWLARREGTVYWTGNSHDWHDWVSRTEEIRELLPGDSSLPSRTRQGEPWPRSAGGLLVATRFNTETKSGHDALSNVRFFDSGPLGPQTEWSMGYHVPRGGSYRTREGLRAIRTADVWEYGPTLFGAHPLVGTLATKARQERRLSLSG